MLYVSYVASFYYGGEAQAEYEGYGGGRGGKMILSVMVTLRFKIVVGSMQWG